MLVDEALPKGRQPRLALPIGSSSLLADLPFGTVSSWSPWGHQKEPTATAQVFGRYWQTRHRSVHTKLSATVDPQHSTSCCLTCQDFLESLSFPGYGLDVQQPQTGAAMAQVL